MSRSLQFDVTARDSASREFAAIATQVERLEDRLKRLDRVKVEPTAQLNITPATRSAAQLEQRLNALRNVRATVAVDGAAEARREVTGLVVEMRKLRNVRVRIDIDGNGRADMAAFATSLRTLNRAVKVKVDLDDGTFARDIARLHQRVSALRGTTVRIDFDIRPPGIREELNSIATSLRALRGTTSHRVDVDTTASRKSLNETILSFKLLAAAAASPLAIPGIFSATASLLSLGGAAVSATGALGLLPAAGLAGGAAMATFAVGLAHVSDALGPTGTPAQIKKVEEALAALSPAARAAVDTIRALGPAWSDLRLDVQERLFRGVSDQIQGLADTYLPVLKTGLGGIADELNVGATMWADWMRSASTVAGVTTILGNTERAMQALAPAGVNVSAALTDIGVVGSEILPELAGGATVATERFREFIAEARKSGELEQWIRGGLDTLGQLGDIAGNTGGILGGMYAASEAAGADFLGTTERVTFALSNLANSTRGQERLTTIFRESQASVDAMLPGVEALTVGVLDLLANFSTTQGLQEFGALISRAAIATQPLISYLGTLAGETLGALAGGANLAVAALTPIVGLTTGISSGLGPVVPLVVASVIAFKGLGLAVPGIVALGTSLQVASVSAAMATGALTGSAAATLAAGTSVRALGTAVGAIGRALPIAGVAAIGFGFAVQGMTVSTSDAATAMLAGGRAAEDMRAKIASQNADLGENASWVDKVNNSVNEWFNTNVFGVATMDSVNEATRRQTEGMTGLERAQQAVTAAQNNYQVALDDFGARSPQAIAAADTLASATDRVEVEQRAAADATKTHTDRMVEQADQQMASVNAALGYEGALLNLERAQQRAADAVRDHGAGSLEAREAEFALTQQHFATAAAAGEKARADAEATGATNGAEVAARAHKDELLRLAGTLTGPARDALLTAANAIDIQGSSSGAAEARTRLHKDELNRLAGQASGQTASALSGLAGNFDSLGGATASAETRARLQREELLRLAGTMSGPLRTELTNMANQLRTLPDADFTVTANGRGQFEGVHVGGGRGGTITREATGGVLSGYTPGRDVHRFVSGAGDELHLSGGEAVMRPEWTRAVGANFVNAANRAARSGGIAGVQDFIARTAPRRPGIEGRAGDGSRFASGGVRPTRYTGPVQRLAAGGLVRAGIHPYPELARRAYIEARDRMADHMTPIMQRRIREAEAAARAASGSGPVTAGAAAGLSWARTQVGKPYVWGGVGPGGYDCSGFMSGIVNVMRGRNPHSRVGATGTFPWGGFRPGIGPGLNIGSFRGSPGHMAGTIGGVNVESSGGVGVRVGGGARGAGHSMFNTRAHLADRGGLIRSGDLALNLSGRAERMLSPRQTDRFDELVSALTGDRVDLTSQMRDRPMPGVRVDVERMVGAVQRSANSNATQLGQLRSEFANLAAAVATARPITVEDRSGNPTETARATQLALRLYR